MRALSIDNLYAKKYDYMPLDGIWSSVMGLQTREGAMLIYGSEKNGKTTFALMLANYFSSIEKVLYVSAEEGLSDTFQSSCRRAGILHTNKSIRCIEYIPLDILKERLRKRKSEKIVFIDNLTVYGEELKGRELWKLINDFPRVLFVFIAHEKDGEPYTATAKMCKRLSKLYAHVSGLVATIGGRCPGGQITINEDKAMLNGSKTIKP